MSSDVSSQVDPDASPAKTAAAFRSWLHEHAGELEPFRSDVAEELEEAVARFRPLQQMLWDHGWNRLGWPTDCGGLGGSAVHRYSSCGELTDIITLPVDQVTACTLGGTDGRTLFITTSALGLDRDVHPAAGAIFTARVAIAGERVSVSAL